MNRPWIVAHRGASGLAPENTMAAFRRAVELGARVIETDLQVSRDGQFVAIHDGSVQRTTNGRGRVSDLTLDELRELDAGSWFGASFAGERVPTLAEILDFARESDLTFCLEVKFGPDRGSLPALLAELRRSERLSQCMLLSFDTEIIAEARRLEPDLVLGLLLDRLPSDPISAVECAGAQQIVPRHDLVVPKLVEQAHQAGLRIATWTVNDPNRMRTLVAAGVDAIVTDYPDRLAAVLRT